MFSRIAAKLPGEANALYRLRDELKLKGHPIRDLISGNINDQGFLYPQELLEDTLIKASRRCTVYHPDSFGQRPARESVSRYYATCGHSIDPECILLAPGTSLSYWYSFKLLADEGDEILCPCPSYPLFDYIALLSGVRLIPYRLEESRNWAIDIEQLESTVSTKTRAIVLISPHNPTGHVASADELAGLVDVARRHDLAIISDEVFSEFLLVPGPLPRPAGFEAPLVITLNGFSKMFALPGIKLGWMALSGDFERVSRAMRALELISDTFLPVNEIVQAAVPELFQSGMTVKKEFAKKIQACWNATEKILASSQACDYVKPAGGFYVTLSLNQIDEEHAAEAILRENHLLVHPGYFYDMNPDHLILSFVHNQDTIRDSFPVLLRTVASLAGNPGARP
jgi:alanine-synthesizing transaminase